MGMRKGLRLEVERGRGLRGEAPGSRRWRRANTAHRPTRSNIGNGRVRDGLRLGQTGQIGHGLSWHDGSVWVNAQGRVHDHAIHQECRGQYGKGSTHASGLRRA
jgi:hypothetical protein